ARTGVATFESHDHSAIPGRREALFFTAAIVASPGLAEIQLRHDGTVLAGLQTGDAPPAVAITSPAGGAFATGAIPVAWTASDPDGDPVQIVIQYPRDAGAHWQPVGFGDGSGSQSLQTALLGGGDARIRITASDGFHSATAVSPAFSVGNQPPRP